MQIEAETVCDAAYALGHLRTDRRGVSREEMQAIARPHLVGACGLLAHSTIMNPYLGSLTMYASPRLIPSLPYQGAMVRPAPGKGLAWVIAIEGSVVLAIAAASAVLAR